MKHTFLFFILLLIPNIMEANHQITGILLDANDSTPLPYATITLLDRQDTIIKGTTTAPDGTFRMDGIQNGNYRLHLSFLGYTPQSISLINLTKDISLGEIRLQQATAGLAEVIIESNTRIHKADRQLVLPTIGQKRISSNGITLLQHLQIPDLIINPMDKSISTAAGNAVQLRINGIEATRNEILALRPADIVHIEYHSNPGLRYGNAAAVLNYIVKKKEQGGNVAADLINGIYPLGAGDYNLSAAYNRNHSAFSLTASWERRDLKWTRENTESFLYPDHTVINTEIGQPTRLKYDNLNAALNYNYIPNAMHMLNIALRTSYNNTPNSFSDRNSTLISGNKEYSVIDRQSSQSLIPSLDIYYQLNLPDNSHLYIDLLNTYIGSSSQRTYSITENDRFQADFKPRTSGDKYSLIGEIIYERPLATGRITAGLKHNSTHMSNTYEDDTRATVRMNTAETYLFAEYQGSYKRFNYIVGLGATRTYHRQATTKHEQYIFRPTLTLSYNPIDPINLRYNAYISSYSPALSQLSDVTQAIDAYQVRRGNPNLKSVMFVANSLTTSYAHRYFSIELSGRYSYDDKPIMEETLYENDLFVRTYANQKGFHRLNIHAAIQITPWKEYIAIRLIPFFNRYISLGHNYTHAHSNPGFRGSIIGMYKNWSFMAEMNTSYHSLWGETITKGESLHTFAIGYNRSKWGIQAMMMNPFTKRYEQSIVNLSHLAPNTQLAYSTDFSPMFMLNVSFNLDFGHQRIRSSRRINNSDTDTGILNGTK